MTSRFKIKKGIRQECVMSPLLFNLYIADIDKHMKEREIAGVKVGKNKV